MKQKIEKDNAMKERKAKRARGEQDPEWTALDVFAKK